MHRAIEEAPVSFVFELAGHSKHVVLPLELAYVLEGQGVQLSIPVVRLNHPAGQSRHM